MNEQNRQPQKKRSYVWIKAAKIAWFPLACLLALAAGLTAGYVVLGDQPLREAANFHSWKHLIDLVFAE